MRWNGSTERENGSHGHSPDQTGQMKEDPGSDHLHFTQVRMGRFREEKKNLSHYALLCFSFFKGIHHV